MTKLQFRQTPFKPWMALTLFGLFALANFLLSYVPLPLTLKIWVFVLGILAPFLAAFLALKPAPESSFQKGSLSLPAGLLGLLFVGAVFLRLYRLSSLTYWPLHDEAMHSYLALELAQGAKPRMFYTFSQFPPFYIWGLGLFFKFVEPSLETLWVFPALICILTLALAWAAARWLLPPRLAFLFFFLSAFSFWPLLQGRFSHAGILVLFWEYLALAAAGFFWKAGKGPRQKAALVLFGMLTGLGFYVFTSWLAVALPLAALAWLLGRARKVPAFHTGALFLLPLLLASAPYFYFLTRDGDMGRYAASILPAPAALWTQLSTSLSYFTALWWGPLVDGAYTPDWGGFLNPLLGALFFLGLLRAPGLWKSPWVLWAFLSFFVMMSAGALTANLECLRIIQVLPLLLLAAAWGGEELSRALRALGKSWALILLLGGSFALDAHHLFGVCPQAWGPRGEKTYPENGIRFYSFRDAYQALKEASDRSGPGLILTNLLSPPDPSLIVSTFPFNVALNPRLGSNRLQWGALLVNENDYPFWRDWFRMGEFRFLPQDFPAPDGSLMVVILPMNPSTEPFLKRLKEANMAMEDVAEKTLRLNFKESHQAITSDLLADYPYFQGDRLMETIFWRAVFLHASADRDFGASLWALLQAQKLGYPTAAVYNELGYLRFLQGRYQDAQEDYERALGCSYNHTDASKNLTALRNGYLSPAGKK